MDLPSEAGGSGAGNRESEPAGSERLPRNVKLLGLTSLLNDTASEMLVPLLPDFVLGLPGGSKAMLGLIDGLADTLASLLKLWSGAWSDWVGRRKAFIFIGYALAGLSRPLMSLALAPWHVVALRAADRMGKGIRTAPRDALIADSTPKEQHGRAFGFHRAMDHLGAALGPLIAYTFLFVFPDKLRWLFALSLVPAIPILVVLTVGLKESSPHAPRGDMHLAERDGYSGWSLLQLPPDFRRYLLSLLVFTLGNSSDLFLLARAKELGVGQVWLPILWLVFHLAKSGGNLVCGGWVDRFGPRPLIWAGWLLYAAVYLAFGLATTAWHAWALFLVYAMFYSLTEPAEKALVVRLVGPVRKGLAYGWFNLTIGIAALPASVIFGWLYDRYGAMTAFSTGACLALVAAMLLGFVADRTKP